MPVDLSEFEAADIQLGPKIETILDDLDADRRAKLEAALARTTGPNRIGHAAIAKVLKAWQYTASPKAVKSYRDRHHG